MLSGAIEGELSHLANHIFSPSMTTLDVLSEPISQPILNNPLMLFLLSLMMTLEIHQDTQSIGVMKVTRTTKKSNDNGWNVLRTYMPLLKNGWIRTKPYG